MSPYLAALNKKLSPFEGLGAGGEDLGTRKKYRGKDLEWKSYWVRARKSASAKTPDKEVSDGGN